MNREEELRKRIEGLKGELNAVILAHNYQIPEVQDIADFRGDSLDLSRKAAETDADVIIFCGVYFMAEVAAILSPKKKVILPELAAGCPLADMAEPSAVREKKKEHPGSAVVTYVNSSAAVKAESDICCTSANALRVVEYIPNREVIFVPDKNLGHFVSRFTRKKMILWDGYCPTHHRLTPEEVLEAKRKYPKAKVVVHPECRPEVIDLADEVASTSGMITFAEKTDADEIIVGTEIGMIHRLSRELPEKRFYIASPTLVCPTMKLTTLESIASSLETLSPVITVPDDIAVRAKKALDRMLEVPRER
jgi:quinolinate synthase